MTVDELIVLLTQHKEVHPNIQVINANTKTGRVSSSVGLHIRKKVLSIEGE